MKETKLYLLAIGLIVLFASACEKHDSIDSTDNENRNRINHEVNNTNDLSFEVHWSDDDQVFKRSMPIDEISSVTFYKENVVIWRVNFRHSRFDSIIYGKTPDLPGSGRGKPRQTYPVNDDLPVALKASDEIVLVLNFVQDFLESSESSEIVSAAPGHGNESWLFTVPDKNESSLGINVQWP